MQDYCSAVAVPNADLLVLATGDVSEVETSPGVHALLSCD